MSETPLESIRRQMRESEVRLLKDEGGSARQPSSPNPGLPDRQPEVPHLAPQPESFNEWAAYGLMTPGFLNEISIFIGDNIREILERVPAHSESGLTRFIQTVDMVRSLLSRWIESAEFLPSSAKKVTYPDLVLMALNARQAELLRCGIKAELEDATAGLEGCACTPGLFQAILHVMQYCIEQLRGWTGLSNLRIRIQNPGERLETTFIWDSPHLQGSAGTGETGSVPYGKNVELQAAQRLLNAMGGTLVLENIRENQHAVRVTIALAALAEGSGRDQSKA